MRSAACLVFVLVPALACAQRATDTGRTPESTFTGLAAPAPNVMLGNGSFTETESTMSPRFLRAGAPGGLCEEFSSGNYQFKEVALYTDGSGQLTVSFDPQSLDSRVYVTFHTERFDPSSICRNYVWSNGSSVAFTQTFAVPPYTEMRMVVSAVQNVPTLFGGPYAYSLTGANATPTAAALPVATPALDDVGLILMTLLLGAIGVATAARRI